MRGQLKRLFEGAFGGFVMLVAVLFVLGGALNILHTHHGAKLNAGRIFILNVASYERTGTVLEDCDGTVRPIKDGIDGSETGYFFTCDISGGLLIVALYESQWEAERGLSLALGSWSVRPKHIPSPWKSLAPSEAPLFSGFQS